MQTARLERWATAMMAFVVVVVGYDALAYRQGWEFLGTYLPHVEWVATYLWIISVGWWWNAEGRSKPTTGGLR